MKRRYVFGIVLLLVLFLTLCTTAVAEEVYSADEPTDLPMIKLEDLPTDVFVGTKLSVSGRKIQCDELRTEARITDPVTGEEKNELMEIPVQDTYCTIADDTVLVREIAGTWSDGAPSAGTSLTINASNCEVTGTPAPGSKVALLETDGTLHAFQAGQGTNSSTLVVGERIPAADCISYANLQTRRAIPLPFQDIPIPSASGILKLSGGQIIFNLELEFRQTGHASFYLRVRDFSFELNLPKVYNHIYNPIGMISTEIPLGKFEIPVAYGLGLDFTPTFSLEGEGWGPCEFSLNQKGGMVLEMELDFPKKFRISRCGYYRSLPSSKMLDTELNGELYYGFSWGPMLSCLEGIISVGPTVKAGMTARSRRSPTDTQFEPDWKTRNVYHACAPGKCYEGEFCISEGPIAVSVTILYISTTIQKITEKKDYPPHGYFFRSLTYGDRSLNEHCWHRAYKLRVYADTKHTRHSPPQKAHITYSVIPDGRYEWVASDDTKEFQPAVIYVPAGRHTITGTIVSPADPSIKQTVTMDIDMPRNTAGTETRTLLFDIPTYEIKFDSNIGEPVQYMPPAIRIQPFYTPKAYITSYAPEVISGRVAFIGWNTEPDGSGTMYAPGSTVTVEKDMTLYAQWTFTQNSWYIIFNANGGEKAPLGQIIPKGQAAVLTDEIAWWDSDIYFKGWSTEPEAINPEYKPGDTVPYQQDVSTLMLYAVWEFPPARRPVEIRYDANDVAGAEIPERQWVMPFAWFELPAAIPPLGGNIQFLGWSTDPSSAEPQYLSGTAAMFEEDTVLYAVWYREPKTASLYFRDSQPGDVSGMPDDITVYSATAPKVKIPSGIPEKPGYYFTGWCTTAEGIGTYYAPGAVIALEKDMTLYARWKLAQDSWYILFDANGGSKAPVGQVVPIGQNAVLTDEIAEWDSDIYFRGWSTEPDAINPEYKPGDTVPYQQDVSFLMLYAVWEFPPVERPVEIRFDANGVDGVSLPATIWVEPYTWIELGDALPPFGSDVQFLGWSANSSAAEPEYTAGQTAQFGEDTVLYAVWYSGAETVNLSFRDSLPGEVSGMPDDITILPSQSPELTIPDDIPEKPGYYFTGWNTAEDGNGTRYAPGSSFTLKVDTILYAQWQLAQNSWYILFNANGGVKAPLGQVVPKGQDAVLTDEIAEWDSDIYFRGWSTEPDAIDPEYKPGDTVPYQQDVSFLMLYAVWEFPPVERPVEIRFDANGADGAEVPRRKWIEPYSWLQLKAAIPPIGGEYTFLGWDRNPNVRTPSFLAGDSYQFSEDTVLYAIWAKGQDTATLAYKDSLEGTVSGLPDPITINPSMSPYVRIPDNIPQKVGMVFTGWNTEKDGSGEGYAPGSIITVTEDTILYAQWTPLGNYWYIVYNANGGSDAPLTQLVQKGQDAVLELQRPRHDTWIFLGWSRDRNAAKPEYQPGGNLPYDSSETFVTLYAVWYMPDSRTVTVSFDANGGDAGTLPGPISVPMLTWFPLPEKTPAWDPQHDFLGWDPKPKAAEPAYKAGDVVLFTKDTVLYAIWDPHYRIIQGAGSTWVKDSKKEHRFAADGNIAYFTEFRFDGKALDSSEYKVTSGSTIIDVSAAAMQKLSVGKHTVEVVYQDGSASAEFTVSKKIPKTGDTAELLLWNGLVLLGIAGLVFVIKQYHSEKRKKK